MEEEINSVKNSVASKLGKVQKEINKGEKKEKEGLTWKQGWVMDGNLATIDIKKLVRKVEEKDKIKGTKGCLDGHTFEIHPEFKKFEKAFVL